MSEIKAVILDRDGVVNEESVGGLDVPVKVVVEEGNHIPFLEVKYYAAVSR